MSEDEVVQAVRRAREAMQASSAAWQAFLAAGREMPVVGGVRGAGRYAHGWVGGGRLTAERPDAFSEEVVMAGWADLPDHPSLAAVAAADQVWRRATTAAMDLEAVALTLTREWIRGQT